MTRRNIVEMLRLEANATEAECKPGTGLNGGVWHEHPELMRQAADEIKRLQAALRRIADAPTIGDGNDASTLRERAADVMGWINRREDDE